MGKKLGSKTAWSIVFIKTQMTVHTDNEKYTNINK